MALNLAAQDFIANKLAGTIKDTTKATANQKTSYTDDKYLEVFNAVQTYVTDTKLNDLNKAVATGKFHVVEDIISGYIQQNFPEYANHAATVKELTQRCLDDMTGYSILAKYFDQADNIEEININGWDNIEVRWVGGRRELVDDKFHNPQHAKDVILRILRQTGRYLDENRIYEVSYIGKAIRMAVISEPAVDPEVGIAASIRFIHSAVFTIDKLVESEFLTQEMADALKTFVNHGISVCVCGATGSGKTTVCNAVLEEISDDTRVITLEGGTREFALIRRDENGKIKNNRLHLQTRPHKDEKLNVDLQLLLDLVLKFDPEVVVVGEMVSEEAFIASETARTGHTVMTTIHTNNAFDAYYRMYSLGIRKYDLTENVMLKFMVDAFPIIVYAKQYPDGKRRIQSILEGQYNNETHRIEYNELFHFNVEDNITTDEGVQTLGQFEHMNKCTAKLRERLMDNGATKQDVENL